MAAITKAERLEQLKYQDALIRIIDREFNKGWISFVRGIQKENIISNKRLFKILEIKRGQNFVEDLVNLMGKKHRGALLRLTRKPEGIEVTDARFTTIKNFRILKNPSGSYREGKVFIQVNDRHWVSFTF